MKTVEQMQDDILRATKWDGGYPKAVALLGGVVCLVRSAEQEAAMRRADLHVLFCALALAVTLLPVVLYHFS